MTGDFLGRGWAFPPAVASDGDVAMATAEEDIRQSVRLIMSTEPGERVMRPDFGCGLRGLVFEPLTTTTAALVRHRVEEARVAVRNIRRDSLDQLRKAEKDGGISQEDERRAQERLQKITDQYIKKVDDVAKRKETEVLEV